MTFECATNLIGYCLVFKFDGTVDEIFEQTNLPNGNIKITTTFIVNSTLNGTGVSCIVCLNNVFKGISNLFYVYYYWIRTNFSIP